MNIMQYREKNNLGGGDESNIFCKIYERME